MESDLEKKDETRGFTDNMFALMMVVLTVWPTLVLGVLDNLISLFSPFNELLETEELKAEVRYCGGRHC